MKSTGFFYINKTFIIAVVLATASGELKITPKTSSRHPNDSEHITSQSLGCPFFAMSKASAILVITIRGGGNGDDLIS